MADAMEQRRLTLTAVRDRLAARGHGVSLATLSYWRSGRRQPERISSLEALPELEDLLGLSTGTLSNLVVDPTGRRVGRVAPFADIVGYPVVAPVAETPVGEGDLSRVATQVTIDVGPLREIQRVGVRRLVVANRDGVDGLTVFMGSDADGDVSGNVVRAVAGCTIDEVRDLASNVRSTRLLFTRPLVLGESSLTEVEVTQAPGAGLMLENDYEIVAEQQLEEAQIWVRFDSAVLPARCWVYLTEGGQLHEWPVELAGADAVHHRQRDFGPGTVGVRWEW